jgi:WD40 repeat protein
MIVDEALLFLDSILQPEHLNDVQELVFRQTWEGRSYPEMAKSAGYDYEYIKFVGFQLWQLLSRVFGEKVTKSNVHSVLRRKAQQVAVVVAVSNSTSTNDGINIQAYQSDATTHSIAAEGASPNRCQDWGEAIDVSVFYGRAEELNQLEQWVVMQHCRLVTLLGMGGIGKTALSIKLAERIQEHFDYIIWRSLRNAPSIQNLLAELLQFLSQQQETSLPETADCGISRLMNYLRQHRCLLVLDNAESIMHAGDSLRDSYASRAGGYREGYQEYGELLRRIGEERHNSCLVLTSREKPKELAAIEGENLPVRSLQLTGLPTAQGRKIFQDRGSFWGSDDEWKSLIEHYAGNPLALKMVAPAIRDLFNSNVSKFLELLNQGTLVFDDIRNLLDRQFARLSALEKELMYWLTLNREPVSSLELQKDLVKELSPNELLETFASLARRSLIEKNSGGFTQQPVVMEYMTQQLIEQICQEIITTKLGLFKSHALLQAQAKDYVRDTQSRLILNPIAKQLLSSFESQRSLENQLNLILTSLRGKAARDTGYAAGNVINLLRHMQTDLSGWDFSNLTVWQAYLQDANLHHVNFAGADLATSVFAENFGSGLSVAFSLDGKLLAIGDTNGEINLWKVPETQLLISSKGHASIVLSVVFSPDSRMLASGSADGTVKLWDCSTGECLKVLQGHIGNAWSVAFSPDGHSLASGSGDGTLRCWDLNTGECLKTWQAHLGQVWSVAFSPQGRTLASSSADNTMKLWDVSTGQCLKTFQSDNDQVQSVAFSPDGKILASGGNDSLVRCWDISTGECFRICQAHTQPVLSVTFSPDGKTLASCSEDWTVRLWDVLSGQCLKTLQAHTNRVSSVAISPDGKTVASCSEDYTLKLWNANTGQCLKTVYGQTSPVYSVALSPQGETFASGDRTLRLWNAKTGQCLKSLRELSPRIVSIAYSPDGHLIATSCYDTSVKLWDATTGKCLKTLQGHTAWSWGVAISPDGKTLASSGGDYTVKLWNIKTGQCLKTCTEHQGWVFRVAFSPSNNILASASADSTVKLWDSTTGEVLRTCTGHASWVWSVAFSPSGNILASGSADNTVKFWDVSTGQCLKTMQGHDSMVVSVIFSPDGTRLVSGSHDRTVRLWDVSTGECLKVLQGHDNWVWSVAFSLDGHSIASASQDETIKLWDAKTGDCLKTLPVPKPYEGMNITGVTSLTDAQKATLNALGAVEVEVESYPT